MRVTSTRSPFPALLLVTAIGCHRPALALAPTASTLAGDWTLTELNGQPAPAVASGRRATLHFEAASTSVQGYAGCNRLGATYMIAGDSLHFETVALTRMVCAGGMELERRLADALTTTNRYSVTSTGLILFGVSGSLARFARATP